ncbi:MAG: hypothetical protein ACRC54_01935 [Fusobacteriaceae bacterium]
MENKLDYKQNKNYYDDDEIDFLEALINFINFFLKNLKLILKITVVVTLFFGIMGKYLERSSKEIVTKIKINENVINSGRFPNGEAFNKNKIISSSELKKLYEKYKFYEEFPDITKFYDSLYLKEVPLDSRLAEKGMKSQEYIVTFAVNNIEKGKEFFRYLIMATIRKNKEKQKPKIVETKLEDILMFDYIDRGRELDNYIGYLKNRVNAIKNSSITEEEEKILKNINSKLYILSEGRVFDYTSYLLKNKLTDDINAFKINSDNRIYKLEEDIKRQKDRILVLKEVIEVYKSQIGKDSNGTIAVDKYYSELIEEYKTLNNQLLGMKNNLELYKKYIQTIRETTPNEKQQLYQNLSGIMTELSSIKKVIDDVSDSYYDKLYSDLIILNSSIEVKSKVNIKLFILIGAFLGVILGTSISFIRSIRNENNEVEING